MILERWLLVLAGVGAAFVLIWLLAVVGAAWALWLQHRERLAFGRDFAETVRAGRVAAEKQESTPRSPEDLLRRAGS